jgi:hypothetical protein
VIVRYSFKILNSQSIDDFFIIGQTFFLNSEIGPLSDVGDLTVPDSTQDPLPPSRPVANEIMTSDEAHSAIAAKNTVTQTEGGVNKPMDVMAEAEPCSPALQSSSVIDLTGQSLPFTIGKKTKTCVIQEYRAFFLPWYDRTRKV